jgi:hypothetical protein
MIVCRLLTASAMLLLSIPARAARPHDAVALEYRPSAATAARCPAADFLREEVQIRIGYDLFQPEASPRLTVKIDRFDHEYRVTGELRSEAGSVALTDTFTEVECGAALRSLAIAVAIRYTRPPEACPLPRPTAPVPACGAIAPPPVKATQRPPESPDRARLQMGIASTFSVGSAPVVVGGAAWFLGARWDGFSAAVEGQALFASSTDILRASSLEGYQLLATNISASGCIHPTWAFACAQMEWGSLSFYSTAVSVDPNRVSHLGLGFRFGGERRLTRAIALRAYVDTLFDLTSGTLRTLITGPHAVWHKPAFSGALGFGPTITF